MSSTYDFCTLFDHRFLPAGLALYRSLEAHFPEFRIFVLCVDDLVYEQLQALDLSKQVLLPLHDYETPQIKNVREKRNHAEFCWTLTPQLFSFVKQADPALEMVTYLDADLFFFDSPQCFFNEFVESGKDILITDHAFAPKYEHMSSAGQFCVQYITVRYTERALAVIAYWQEQCIEWCYENSERDMYGDQKYLDEWPTLYPQTIHILEQKSRTLAPWNLDYYHKLNPLARPVFYHFHDFRIFHPRLARSFVNYHISKEAQWVYDDYVEVLRTVKRHMEEAGIEFPTIPLKPLHHAFWRYLKWCVISHRARIQVI